MKRVLLLVAFITATCIHLHSQTVSYEYDQAGNRIARKVITVGSSQIKRQTGTADSTVVKDVLGKQTIIVYPNPTHGALGVEIAGVNPEEQIIISIYNGQGTQLYYKTAENGINSINMTAYPVGWYILRVQMGSYKKEYKIIKQ